MILDPRRKGSRTHPVMQHSLLFLFEIEDADTAVSSVAEQILAHWPGRERMTEEPPGGFHSAAELPQIKMVSSFSVVIENGWPDHREPSACVVLVNGETLEEGFFPFLDYLEERSVPLLIIAKHFSVIHDRLAEESNVIICSSDEPAEQLAARLHALMLRQRVVRELRRDLQIARRFQGGLNREINRIEEELQLAAMIQREFLPKELPELGDLRMGVFFRPVGFVSGDIYHISRLDEHHVGFFLADAVGHGVPAALMTMIIAHSLTMKDIYRDSYRIIPPGEVLAHLNDSILNHHADNGRFATSVYGVIDTRNYHTTIAAAGHPSPLRINQDGESEFIEAKGGLLGVFPDEVYEEVSFTLEEGDRLFIYSDGFEMAFPNPKTCNLADPKQRRLPSLRYLDEIRRACGLDASVEETIEALRHAVDREPGSLHQVDDLTGICLARQRLAGEVLKEEEAEALIGDGVSVAA